MSNNQPENRTAKGFVPGDRGDRMHPDRMDRCYWHLKLLLNKLQSIVDSDLLEAGEKILDYGCGNKPYRSLFEMKFREYVAADLPGNKHCDIVIGPDGQLPVEKDSFDCVLSSEVLEHTIDPYSYLRESYRV